MPKRKSMAGGGRSGSKRRRSSARKTSSAFRLKSTASTKVQRGRKLKRFGRRLKKGKAGYPGWFKTLIKGVPSTDVSGQYAAECNATIAAASSAFTNPAVAFTVWKNRSMYDYQLACDYIAGAADAKGSTLPSDSDTKVYISDVRRKHIWRNNASGGSCEIQFYQLTPRRSVPAGTLTISPVVGSNYGTGGIRVNPTMLSTPLANEFNPTTGAASGTQITGNTWGITPFMSGQLTTIFKIRPFSGIQGPNGKGSKHVLQSGQECSYEGVANKPVMVSFNKLFLSATSAIDVAAVWNLWDNTPLILGVARGGVGHDKNTPSNVGSVPVFIDHFTSYTLKIWQPMPVKKYQWYPTTSLPNYGALDVMEQAAVVLAADASVLEV
nr:MAG: capsid protein [Cressdnaviricota sp.]